MNSRLNALCVVLGITGIAWPGAGIALAGTYDTKTRAEYIAEADPICKKADARIDRALHGIGKDFRKSRLDAAAEKLARAIRVFARSLGALSELEPPLEDADLIEQWLGLERKDVRVNRDLAKALHRERIREASRLFKATRRIEKKIVRLIGDFGFRACN